MRFLIYAYLWTMHKHEIHNIKLMWAVCVFNIEFICLFLYYTMFNVQVYYEETVLARTILIIHYKSCKT